MPQNQDGTFAPQEDDEDIVQYDSERDRRQAQRKREQREKARRDAARQRKKDREAREAAKEHRETARIIHEKYPWMPNWQVEAYTTGWINNDENVELAKNYVRDHPKYEKEYAGNLREDGTVRMEELDYKSAVTAYEAKLRNFGVNPKWFKDEFVNLLENEVSPVEFAARLDEVDARVLAQAPAIKQYYAEYHGLNLTKGAIFAAVLKPELSDAMLNRSLTVAEVGGEASLAGFQLGFKDAEALYNRAYNRGSSAQLFAEASKQIPLLDALSRRHLDDQDDFDLSEFLDAAAFGDNAKLTEMQRLLGAERAMFSEQGLFESDEVGLSGLTTR